MTERRIEPLRVLVCGGRNFHNYRLLSDTLDALCDEFGAWTEPDGLGNKLPWLHIIAGKSPGGGADDLAIQYAMVNWTGFTEFPPDIKTHGRVVAMAVRNQQMLDEGKPHVVIGMPGGSGTADMLRRACNDGFDTRAIGYGRRDDREEAAEADRQKAD